jgi:cytochrome c-type biogenesis protein CcsB
MTDAVTLSEYTQVVSAGTGVLFLASAVRSFVAPLASRVLHKLAVMAMLGTIALGIATYVQRWVDVGHVPTQTFWEALIMAALCAQIAFAVVYGINGMHRVKGRSAGVVDLFGLLMCAVVGAFYFYARTKPNAGETVPPVLDSVYFIPHVSVMILGYGAGFCAAIMGIVFLIASVWLAKGRPDVPLETHRGLTSIDQFCYRAVMFGFPLLTAGLVLGGLWANESWGTYWGFDSKETWALITWLCFLGYLHLRFVAGWRGRRSAWFLAAGGVVIFITFLLFGYLPDSVASSQHRYIN